MARVLIVDDDEAFGGTLAETIQSMGHQPARARSISEAIERLRDFRPGAAFLDLRLGEENGLDLLRNDAAAPLLDSVPVVVLTAHADSRNTIEAMRLGAFEHLAKPIGRAQIQEVLERALKVSLAAIAERDIPRAPSSNDEVLIGSSPVMRELQKQIGRAAAASDATVLIQGETGTGKELVARALHDFGARSKGPFVGVNCAAIPADLLESELFGHVKGAFTGAYAPRTGRFREANGGTIFLDEIGDMQLPMQAKLLRVLQERMVTPVGGSESVSLELRVVAATHCDLLGKVQEGSFREDLFYRLNVVTLRTPPLRERGSDILLLAEHFLEKFYPERPKRITPAAAKALLEYAWPGNVRELQNLMQRVSVVVSGPLIDVHDLTFVHPGSQSNGGSAPPLVGANGGLDDRDGGAVGSIESLFSEEILQRPMPEAIALLEKVLIERALARSSGNKAEAARLLGIRRQYFYTKLAEHGFKIS